MKDRKQKKVLHMADLGEYRRPHGTVWQVDGQRILATVEANRAAIEVDVDGGKVSRVVTTGQQISPC